MYFFYLAYDIAEYSEEEILAMMPKIEKHLCEEFTNVEITPDRLVLKESETKLSNLDNISTKFNYQDRLDVKKIAYRLNVLSECDALLFINIDCKYTDSACKIFNEAAGFMGIPIYEYDPDDDRIYIVK